MKIYALLDDSNNVFYVGITYRVKDRLKKHLYESAKMKYPVHIFIQNLLKKGKNIKAILLDKQYLDKQYTDDIYFKRKEGFWIREMIKQGYKLTNINGTTQPIIYDESVDKELEIKDEIYFNGYQSKNIRNLLETKSIKFIHPPIKYSRCRERPN